MKDKCPYKDNFSTEAKVRERIAFTKENKTCNYKLVSHDYKKRFRNPDLGIMTKVLIVMRLGLRSHMLVTAQ